MVAGVPRPKDANSMEFQGIGIPIPLIPKDSGMECGIQVELGIPLGFHR